MVEVQAGTTGQRYNLDGDNNRLKEGRAYNSNREVCCQSASFWGTSNTPTLPDFWLTSLSLMTSRRVMEQRLVQRVADSSERKQAERPTVPKEDRLSSTSNRGDPTRINSVKEQNLHCGVHQGKQGRRCTRYAAVETGSVWV